LRERKAQPTNGKPVPHSADRVDELEPYRRLIRVQKQLAEMAKQNEQTKRECDALREQVEREGESLRSGAGLRHRLRRSAVKLLKRLPRILANESSTRTLNRKHTTHVKGR
jgi:hypothetical protein